MSAFGQTSTNGEWWCESPRSGREVPDSRSSDMLTSLQVCQDIANTNDVNYTLKYIETVTKTVSVDVDVDLKLEYDIQPGGSTPPTEPPPTEPPPTEPPPTEPPPTDPNLPPFTFNIEGAAKDVLGAHDPVCTSPTVYHVTSLSNDRDQPGTLMNAVREDCRYIVFDVAGEIDMTNTDPNFNENGGPNTWLIIRKYLTIDGRTAPDPGITLTNVTRISIECRGPRDTHCNSTITERGRDIIVSNIRTVGRDGPNANPNLCINHSHWLIDGSEAWVGNIALDHLTMVNTCQGSNIYNRVRNVTVQHSLSYGGVLGGHISGQWTCCREDITLYKNVLQHSERQYRLRYQNNRIDIVGNTIHGWGFYECGGSGANFATSSEPSSGNFEFNRYIFRPVGACPVEQDAMRNDYAGMGMDLPGPWYFANNIWPAGEEQGDNAGTVSTRVPTSSITREYASRQDILNAGVKYPTSQESNLLQEIVNAAGL
jgi:hypothetical protein